MKFILFSASLVLANQIFAQSPGGVATNNTIWLRSDQSVTLATDGSMEVDIWGELSGAGMTGDFSTHNPGAGSITQYKPSLINAGVNFNPYVVFNQTEPNCISSNNLFNGNSIFGSTEVTMFQVINLHTSTGTGVWCKWQTSNVASGRLGNEVNNGGTGAGKIRFDFRGGNLFSSVSVLNKHTMFTGTTSGNNLILRLFGAQDNQITVTGSNTNPGTARIALGNDNEAGIDAYPSTVDIAELIMYSRSLTPIELNKVESYLAIKYGMTLVQTGTTPNDYLSSIGTVVWDNSSNDPYFHNITGIGRDDGSGLSQKQSKSINDQGYLIAYNGVYSTGAFPEYNSLNTNNFTSDQSLFLFGDNEEDTALAVCNDDGKLVRMERIWKVQETGNVGMVTIAFDNTIFSGAQALLVSDDPTFTTGVTTVALDDNGTLKYASFDFNTGQYFTFGSQPIALNGEIDSILCLGMTANIHLNPTGGIAPYSYTWNTEPPQTGSSATGLDAGTYTVDVTFGPGCIYSESFVVTGSNSSISAEATVTDAICKSSSGRIVVDAGGGIYPYTYQISGSGAPQSSNMFEDLPAGTYTITIKDVNGCSANITVVVGTVERELEIGVEVIDPFCDIENDKGKVFVNAANSGGTPPYVYTISGLGNFYSLPILIPYDGKYEIILSDVYGCEGKDTFDVETIPCCQIMFPTAFSPNGDGLNDEFMPYANESILEYKLMIFNRWGELVFQSFKPEVGWNGESHTGIVDGGVYFYRATYFCPGDNKLNEYKGELTLIR